MMNRKGATVWIHTGRGPPGRATCFRIGPTDLERRRRHRHLMGPYNAAASRYRC